MSINLENVKKENKEMDPQERRYRRRKDMIKNFAIVFLAIMLALTFFSNTIMNYSLPQVAVQYVESGSITSSIRGTGTVESGDPYNVMVKETRTVNSILCRVGETVSKGELLLNLDGEDSAELEEAKKNLEDAKKTYDDMLLSIDITASIISSSQQTISTTEYRAKITAAQNEVDAAQAEVDKAKAELESIENQLALANTSYVPQADKSKLEGLREKAENAKEAWDAASARLTAAKEAIAYEPTAKKNAEDAAAEYEEAKAVYEAAKAAYENAESSYNTADTEYNNAVEAYENEKANYQYDTKKNALDVAQEELNSIVKSESESDEDFNTRLNAAQEKLNSAQAEFDSVLASLEASAANTALKTASAKVNSALAERDSKATAFDVAENEYLTAKNASTAAANEYSNAQTAAATASSKLDSYKTEESNAKKEYDAALKEYNDLNSAVNNSQNSGSDNISSLEAQKAAAEIKLSKANESLQTKTQELGDLIGDISLIRNLNVAHEAITEAQKQVDKLTKESAAMEVTAPISGTILEINVTSGKKTDPSSAAVVIQPEGQSFTMSFTVTNDEAKTISVGANATVTNSWWYNDVTGSVASIRPDTSSPNTSKLVTLNLYGSLVAGQSLTMTIDTRTSNYDTIVPNSAVHEDNNGKFILVVESKSSPLGNRYFATRYDVQVLASDDTKSAVKAGLAGYEYVITTSSKPISAGDQVRLSDN